MKLGPLRLSTNFIGESVCRSRRHPLSHAGKPARRGGGELCHLHIARVVLYIQTGPDGRSGRAAGGRDSSGCRRPPLGLVQFLCHRAVPTSAQSRCQCQLERPSPGQRQHWQAGECPRLLSRCVHVLRSVPGPGPGPLRARFVPGRRSELPGHRSQRAVTHIPPPPLRPPVGSRSLPTDATRSVTERASYPLSEHAES